MKEERGALRVERSAVWVVEAVAVPDATMAGEDEGQARAVAGWVLTGSLVSQQI